jgi:CMP-N,N'-diacetyllegionaminic acid synthase
LKFVALIPARGGSKGVKDKNIKLINGKPLILWTIEQAKSCADISRVIVSTDSAQIAKLALEAGAEVPELRPNHLALDTSTTEEAMLHALDSWVNGDDDDVIVLLQPTSPLRFPNSINKAIAHFKKEQADSLVSVCESHAFFWRQPESPEALYDYQRRPRRQDILPKDKAYRENGSIYLSKHWVLKKHNNRLGGKLSMFCMHEQESFEIDSLTDFSIVSTLMQELIR